MDSRGRRGMLSHTRNPLFSCISSKICPSFYRAHVASLVSVISCHWDLSLRTCTSSLGSLGDNIFLQMGQLDYLAFSRFSKTRLSCSYSWETFQQVQIVKYIYVKLLLVGLKALSEWFSHLIYAIYVLLSFSCFLPLLLGVPFSFPPPNETSLSGYSATSASSSDCHLRSMKWKGQRDHGSFLLVHTLSWTCCEHVWVFSGGET